MGATQSKPGTDEKELKAANILDILATKYILTQNFFTFIFIFYKQ